METKHLIFDEDDEDNVDLMLEREGIDLKTDFSSLNKDDLYKRLFNQVMAQALRFNPNPSTLTLAAKLVKLGEKDEVEIEMTTEELVQKIKELSL